MSVNVVNSLINYFLAHREEEIEFFKAHPYQVQQRQLMQLLSTAKQTEWGRKYNFANITSVEEYQKTVPLQTYDSLAPYIERMMHGEDNVLWSSPVKWFAKSSGTTASKSKFIPVSDEYLQKCHFQGGKDVLLSYMKEVPGTEVFYGKALTLGGSHQFTPYDNGIRTGDLSAVMIENTPFYASFIRWPKKDTALLSDFEQKVEQIAKNAAKENITQFAGVPSWNLVLMNYLLDYTGKKNLLEIWPKLELFIHGGIAFTPYRDQYKRLIPSDTMHYMETYNASEGFFAIQDDLHDQAMLLMLDLQVFYEFIPMDSFGTEHQRVYTIDQVEKGINYALVITTGCGLWRYIIGDTVQFTSLSPHKVIITGRTKHFINAFGEEVIVNNAENALRVACEATNAVVKEYTAGPIFMEGHEKGAHEWVIEFERSPVDLEHFIDILDEQLCAENSDYEAKRFRNTTLRRPVVHAVPEGTYYKWMQSRGKLGGQNKVPRLSNNREFIEAILKATKYK